MKSLSIKQILITIVISYLITSFVNAELNPFNLSNEVRIIQIFIIGFSLLIQLGIKNTI
jgi:hypothetical protein